MEGKLMTIMLSQISKALGRAIRQVLIEKSGDAAELRVKSNRQIKTPTTLEWAHPGSY